MRLIKRVMGFKSKDYKHLWFLFKNMHKQMFLGDYAEAYDAWMWIRVHFAYDGRWVEEDK